MNARELICYERYEKQLKVNCELQKFTLVIFTKHRSFNYPVILKENSLLLFLTPISILIFFLHIGKTYMSIFNKPEEEFEIHIEKNSLLE
jgi:hypothetical protein